MYMDKLETILVKKTHKILHDFKIETDYLILAGWHYVD